MNKIKKSVIGTVTYRNEKSTVNHPTMLVVAAACTAYRINKGYLKTFYVVKETTDTRKPNSEIVKNLLLNPKDITEEDHNHAKKIKEWFNCKTFKLLSGDYLSNFDKTVMKMLEKEDITTGYEIATLTSLPETYNNGVQRDLGESRAKFASGGYVGELGQRINVDIEVLKCIYSQKWNTYYITAITDNDQPVFFSYSSELTYGTKLSIKGTVKRQDNNQTQFNRVKVV